MNHVHVINHMVGFFNIQADDLFTIMPGYTTGHDIKNAPMTARKFSHIVTNTHRNKSFKIGLKFVNLDLYTKK